MKKNENTKPKILGRSVLFLSCRRNSTTYFHAFRFVWSCRQLFEHSVGLRMCKTLRKNVHHSMLFAPVQKTSQKRSRIRACMKQWYKNDSNSVVFDPVRESYTTIVQAFRLFTHVKDTAKKSDNPFCLRMYRKWYKSDRATCFVWACINNYSNNINNENNNSNGNKQQKRQHWSNSK